MTSTGGEHTAERADIAGRLALAIGFVLVLIGMANTHPSIPGLEALIREFAGSEGIRIRKFSYEYLFPLCFVIMMTVVALQHSFLRAYGGRGGGGVRLACFAMDAALVVMAAAISAAYLIEIDSVCMIDQLTGERAALIARALEEERTFAELYGLPVPDSVDDPACINTLGVWIFALAGTAIAVFLAYNVKVWGLPLVTLAILVAAYTLITVLVWYFLGADDINRYLVTKLGGEPRQLIDGRPNIQDVLVNNAQGLLGRFMGILMNTVFPYIVLGSLFGASAGGRSLIKLAFLATSRLRGGPAHAAIVSSALFGTISGGPVVNVLSTGVLTIPMMLRRGFARAFAGGVEAAASSGGQIMPPVMGVAAFVLSAMTVVPYREVIIAAIIPAVLFFLCLFLTVVFQARRQGIRSDDGLADDIRLTREDWLHLIMILAPILLILVLLLTPKEAVGCGPVSQLLDIARYGADGRCQTDELPWLLQLLQNSAGDAGSAGWWATALLMVLFFLDREIRAAPIRLIKALASAGVLVSTLYLMFLAVSVIDFCLNLTGLSNYVARDVIFLLNTFGQEIGESGLFLFAALFMTMVLAILLGMGMPTVPAYINVALLMGPLLVGLGIATFTAHMFIFYFAVASAITPPVAVAAFAAASISRSDPVATAIAAVRAGIVMFAIPFVFAFYPELLLIPAARIDPAGSGSEFLPGHGAETRWEIIAWLCLRLVVALYLLASALARHDRAALSWAESGVRIVLAVAILASSPMIYGPAIGVAIALVTWHRIRRNPGKDPEAGADQPAPEVQSA